MTPAKYDVVILGGGIAGLGVAIPLARAGKKVLVLERKNLKGQSTPAAGGILDPVLEMHPKHPLLPLCLKAAHEYPSRIRGLMRRTGMDVGYKKTGMFYAAFNAAEKKILKKREAWQKKSGLRVRWLEPAQILKREPALAKNIVGGIEYSDIARIQPKKLHQALRRDAELAGVHFSSDSGLAEGSIVVNALGSWAGLKRLPIQPVRGQIEIIRSGLKIKTILHTVNGGYIVPWDPGTYLLGSTVEFAGYKPKVTAMGLKSIRKRTEKLVPALRGAKTVETWSGLRPFSKTGLPIIGLTAPGHYLACGYYRSGILIGMTAGELLAKNILTGKTPPLLRPFDPRKI